MELEPRDFEINRLGASKEWLELEGGAIDIYDESLATVQSDEFRELYRNDLEFAMAVDAIAATWDGELATIYEDILQRANLENN